MTGTTCPGAACDLARETLADRALELESERDAYRQLYLLALALIAERDRQLRAALEGANRLRDELRAVVTVERETTAARQRRTAA